MGRERPRLRTAKAAPHPVAGSLTLHVPVRLSALALVTLSGNARELGAPKWAQSSRQIVFGNACATVGTHTSMR